MKYVNTHEAKTNLSKLIAEVRQGEEIVICQAGKPVARLTAFEGEFKVPQFGAWRDKIVFKSDWDSAETNAEIAGMFEEAINKPDPE